MIVTIYHGQVGGEERQPAEKEDRPAEMKEHIECDNLKVIRGKDFIRLLFYKDGEFKDNREFIKSLRAFVTERGKTVDRIEFGLNQ